MTPIDDGRILLHAERTATADTLRWVLPGRTPPPAGRLRALLAGVPEIVRVESLADGFLLTKRSGASWRPLGTVIDDAIRAAVRWHRDGEHPEPLPAFDEPADPPTIDGVRAVIAESIGALLASHGGEIEVVEVAPDRIGLALHGACSGCPGSTGTVDDVLATALRRRYPTLRDVTVVRGARRLWPLPARRGR